MLLKKKETVRILSTSKLAEGIFEMWIGTDLSGAALPGQFIMVYPKSGSTLLPRPISICEVDKKGHSLRIVYRVAGAGTTEFSAYQRGDTVDVLGVLGNGYPMKEAEGKRVMLIGGGIGIPPLVELAKNLENSRKMIVLGYRDSSLFLKEDLEPYGDVYIATEDGSIGVKGNVLDAIRENRLEADLIFSCGPMPMLRGIKKYARDKQIPAWISLEERMACGVGACLGCVCKTTHKDAHSHVNNARICTEGPVFLAEDVEI